jgi:hypothetical protein
MNRLYLNDDGSSCTTFSGGTGAIDLGLVSPSGLSFYGTAYRQLCLNNNGNVNLTTSATEVSTYTPMTFPFSAQPLIAPWWGDVDTRGGSLADATHDAVFWDVRPGQFVATWNAVGYYSQHDDMANTFQLVIRARDDVAPGDFDIEFRYSRCEWVSGDASGGMGGHGGTAALAGIDAGNMRDSILLPGSSTESIVNICTMSNIGVNGVWRYAVRGGRFVTL